MDFEIVKISYFCSAILSTKMVIKKENPRAFNIPCTIWVYQFGKSLCELGGSINLIPLRVFKKLGLVDLKPYETLIKDRSIKILVGILYNVLVWVDKFIFPINFVIPDYGI